MKKRAIISFAVLCVLGVIAHIIVYYRIDNQDDTKADEVEGHTGPYSSFQEVRYSPGSDYNYYGGGSFCVKEKDVYAYKCVVEAEITTGGITFGVYNYRYNGDEMGEILDLISEDTITETGTYTYDLNYLSDGWYWMRISEIDEETTANAKYTFSADYLE